MDTHYVKSWSFLFDEVKAGRKKADVRDMRDRDYKTGDIMVLQRFDQATGTYTGEELWTRITHKIDRLTPCALSSAVLERHHCILSLEILEKQRPQPQPEETVSGNGGPDTNTGHGHVWERPDGMKNRCGGPALCPECKLDEKTFGTTKKPKISDQSLLR